MTAPIEVVELRRVDAGAPVIEIVNPALLARVRAAVLEAWERAP